MIKISIKNKSMRKIFAAGIFSLMASTGLTSGANAAACSISGTTSFGYTGAVETCDVIQAGTYGVTAIGANAGGASYGAEISGNINLASGEALTIIVGQLGHQINTTSGQTGGGGSFVFQGTGTGAIPLIVGGGGGGFEWGNGFLGNIQLANASLNPNGMSDASGTNPGGTNGGNGSGFVISGYPGDQGYGYIAVLSNPTNSSFGSFGGGGETENIGTVWTGGGGGGYSGGGGGAYINGAIYFGGGGGSYVVSSAMSTSSQLYSGSTYGGSGAVLFNYGGLPSSQTGTTPASIPEPSSLAILMAALVGLGMAVRYKRNWGRR